MIEMDNPRALFGLAALLVFIVLRVIGDRKYRRVLSLFAGEGKLWFRYRLSRFFFWLFLACLILALSGPRWGSRTITEYRRGLDAVLALDVSRSMEVRDLPGLPFSRLEQGLEMSRLLAEGSAGIRLGAAISRGRGILAVPLTDDTEAITGFLGGLNGAALSGRGTNLEALIDAAASAFLDSFPTRRVIILVSDGESLSGSLTDAIDRAVMSDISFVVLGIGTEEGGPVPSAPPQGTAAEGAAASDSQEEPVISYRRTQVLRNAAERGRGLYIEGNRGDAAAILGDYLHSLAAESGTSGSRREGKPRWAGFVILALISLGFSKCCLLETRRGKNNGQKLPFLVFFLSLFLLDGCSRLPGQFFIMEGNFYHSQGMYTEALAAYLRALDYGETVPGGLIKPFAEYGLGSTYISLDEGEAALERLQASAEALKESNEETGQELSYRISYNRGIVFFERGDYERAVDAFKQALEIDGGRIEAKRNLELSLLSLSREAPSAGSSPGEGGSEGDKMSERSSALFDYLRRKEQNQWKSREWIEEAPAAGPDY